MTYLFDAISFLPLTTLAAAALYAPIAILLSAKRKPYPFILHLANYLLIGYFLALIYVTFFWAVPHADMPLSDRLHLLPGNSFLFALQYDDGLWSSQVMWNVCLFMPLGALLPCVFSPLRSGAWKTVLICLLLSLCIETLQFFIGRVADMDDLIANTLGGAFGRALYTVAAWAMRKIKTFEPIFTDRARTAGHVLAIVAMALILLVPTVIDLVNVALPDGLFPV
jgi:glycopeptide antibiotics resistance protein